MKPARVTLTASSLVLVPLVISAACGTAGAPPHEPGADVIAHVGKRLVRRGEFDAFLAAALGGPNEVATAGAELKSRLLDQYLDDELLVAAALDAGLKVSDEEVKEFQPSGTDADEASIKRILLARRFKQTVILNGVTVSEDQVRAYFERHLNEYRQPARVVLRQMLLDNPGAAKEIRTELAKNPEKFEEIAETRSLAPDGGKPYPLEEALLPETLQKAVARLKEGELSEVVQDPQGFFILKLEERQPEQAPSFEEARQRIELKLLQDRSETKYGEFVAGLREKTKVTIDQEKLGFPYMKKTQS